MTEIAVDIWFDFLCPWCYIGKRRFESALAAFDRAEKVRVRWRSFDLHPGEPHTAELTIPQRLERDLGLPRAEAEHAVDRVGLVAAELGLEYHMRDALLVNSFDAHRLARYGATQGLADEIRERIMRAYTGEGANIADHAILTRLGTDVGLDEAAVGAVLAGDDFADQVRSDHREARLRGVSGVPTVVVGDGPTVVGAQPIASYLDALQLAQGAAPR
ncbi:DsbA family oxidoreductase [Nocardia sp. A7]|uniref:DsbA family oxidoreductase n=1 Tax=Nocardia sp. A7 TaxID=2789274 RepID=UPI00397AFC38